MRIENLVIAVCIGFSPCAWGAEVLVHLKGQANLTQVNRFTDRTSRIDYVYNQLRGFANQSQAPVIRWLKANHIRYRAFYIENVILISHVSKRTLKTIANFPQVQSLSPNVYVRFKLAPGTIPAARQSSSAIPEHLRAITVDRVWQELNVKGRGIVVAGQDTGYYWEHEALKTHYRGYAAGKATDHNYNWHDAVHTTNSPTPFDDTGHGTHTMGTMVGDDGGINKIGVAPEAQWIGCRNMDKGVGSLASYLECFEFFLAPYPYGGDPRTTGRPDLAPHIVNNSWSCPTNEGCTGGELLGSVQALRAAGIFVVVAAGNHGPSCGSLSSAPAFYTKDLVSVGAYNRYSNEIAFFSARGPSSWTGEVAPHLVTYGDAILSSVVGGAGKYEEKMGTSMAAPQVAGVVALLWSAHPELIGQIERTSEILRNSARPLLASESCPGFPGAKVPNVFFGYGMVDAYQALQSANLTR